ncbi:MAG: hypothetical protein EXR86_12635 [Gammaproteobacteria bacterium]|nr:hypothetical protein [Gammaproteobacteria bacterium]
MQTSDRDEDQPLLPTELALPHRADVATTGRLKWDNRLVASAVVCVLVLGTLAVFVLLPRWVTPSAAPTETTHLAPLTAAVTAEDSAAARLLPEPAHARPAAQAALEALLPKVDALRTQQVEHWAESEFRAAEATLAAGEKAYREQRFTQAAQAYTDASTQVARLAARIPQVIDDYLDQGERALLSQDSRAAETAFSQALGLAPDNPAALEGLKRAKAFDKVLALLTEAKGYERMGDSQRAATAFRAALELDSEAAEARLALPRIEAAQSLARFTDAMSEGFRALEAGDYPQAQAAFKSALNQNPRSPEATNALAQTEARAAAAKIDAALGAASRAERSEQWREAAAQYRAALAVDKMLVDAAAGANRADQRAALVTRLEETLKDPTRLTDEVVYHEAEIVLRAATAVPVPGPKLGTQIAMLKAQLVAARTAVPVRVVSDSTTDVTIRKFGRLGIFSEQTLSLYPGRYTAFGKRPGFRDVRIEFTVAAAAAPPTITVQCQEALSFGK